MTYKCKVMEDTLWRVVWSLNSLGMTSDVHQTHHLEGSVMGDCWIICFWTLSYGAKRMGLTDVNVWNKTEKDLWSTLVWHNKRKRSTFTSWHETLVVGKQIVWLTVQHGPCKEDQVPAQSNELYHIIGFFILQHHSGLDWERRLDLLRLSTIVNC